MKKKSFTLLLSLCHVIIAMAQRESHPMFEEGRVWNSVTLIQSEVPANGFPDNFYMDLHCNLGYGLPRTLVQKGDTVINGTTYNKLVDGGNAFRYATRQDGDKIYEWYSDKEILSFDFSLKKGDTFRNPMVTMMVMKTDTIYLKGEYRKRMYMGDPDTDIYPADDFYDIWIEGIGCANGPCQTYWWQSMMMRQLLTVWQGDQLIFEADDFNAPALGHESLIFSTGTKWKEVIAEPGMPLDTLNGAVVYEISTEEEILGRVYKKVLMDGEECDILLREENGKVWLLVGEIPEEMLIYNFNWDTNPTLRTDFLSEHDGITVKDVSNYNMTDIYSLTIGAKTFSCIQDNSGVVVRDIGRVLDWNRTSCVLGYKQPEPVLPGLQAFKLLWMRRGGEEVFRSENADDFTNTSQYATATKTETKPSAIYLPSGQRADTNTPFKGIHIIRYSDGTVKKVYTR